MNQSPTADPGPAPPPSPSQAVQDVRPRIRDYDYQEDAAAADINGVLDQLGEVTPSSSDSETWRACCPAHSDNSPSLSVSISADGTLLLHCHAGCEFGEIWRALGEPRLLGYRRRRERDRSAANPWRSAVRLGVAEPSTPLTMAEVVARLRQATPPNSPDAEDDWATLLASFQASDDEGLIERTAQNLGVDLWALKSLGVGFDSQQLDLIFPEFDGQGRILGLARRHGDGGKQMLPKSHRGLYLSADSLEFVGPIYCCEGPTDAAALLTVGLSAIGRPSASGGIPYLISILQLLPPKREIVVLGENDQRPDGVWPGPDAAIKTAKTLREQLKRTVKVALPPAGAKDVRAWLVNSRASSNTEVSQ